MDKELFDRREEEILKDVPYEFRGTLTYMAYDKSHAYGREEMLFTLESLVFDLKEAIKKFEDRLRKDFEEGIK